ncbi:exodeoxyribonuclease I, partial [Francisella tularensis subsp. holarctica]|nr:exodeoxyribonuclease I [Francisella tularensis subsp. holarctica]
PQERIEHIKANKEFIRNNPETFANLIEYVLEYKYPERENIDTDAAIYQSDFLSMADERGCDKFHRLAIKQKAQMLNQLT